ncbi:hypothetical protein BGAL_0725g00010 [Botrytis galanthina]|uniref:Uncharacterized protein n=1 Tax=Botrytis galanthina TaxID=278940 RepID=A0A4S8QHV5_9HELO|nr:hypothetical protein BGAL_0725g00010 [Botrytis galanthina]
MLTQFSPLHIPCLLTSLPMFLGGLFHGLTRPRAALLTWGMPPSIASSPSAQTVYYGHSMRTSTLGLLTLIFYTQGNLHAVDTSMAVMGAYCGIADCTILWYWGNRKVIALRLASVLGIAMWGLLGLTARGGGAV